MTQRKDRNLFFISLSQFGISFSANFIIVILPFYVSTVSPYTPQETLLWLGWILGSSGIVMTFGSAFWGTLTSRFSPKALFMRGLFTHTIIFLLMGFTSNLQTLLILRIIQGVFGGISTVGLIIISASSSKDTLSADIGFFQTFLTIGLLTGPPAGAFATSLFGYRGAFISASTVLFVSFLICYMNVKDVPRQPRKESFFGRGTINRYTILGWMLCFIVQVQLVFLPSVLPNVFDEFNMEKNTAVRWAGIVIMLYTTTATLGTYFWTKISARARKEKMITSLVICGTLFLSLLVFSHGIVDFTIIRMIQTGIITATIALIISMFAGQGRGGVIGFMNSSRFAGNALGPIIGTSVLAVSNLRVLYLFITFLTLVVLFGFRLTLRSRSFESRALIRD
jgi:MFS family permease